MSDRRLHPANTRVALRGYESGDLLAVDGTAMQVGAPIVDLCPTPDAMRDRQLLLGANVLLIETREGWSFIQASDGYVGYVPAASLQVPVRITHRVSTFGTHAYFDADMKSSDMLALPFGAAVQVIDERQKFFETDQGFVPKKHLRPLDRPFDDPATLAQLHFGVPYLWGGNSTRGIDCSGLISAALGACDLPCPADSDLQRESLGADIVGPMQRGDLVFWQGHVGMMVDADVMIHANAHHMAVAYEPLEQAITRIATQGDGDIVARKRL